MGNRGSAAAGLGDSFRLVIEALDGNTLVGSLNTVAPEPRVGRFGYGVAIGREFQRRGYGRQAGDEAAREQRRERDREYRAKQDMALVSRLTQEILRLFPSCPVPRAAEIAAHTGVRGSGRVGRSAAGRALADEAITSAVVASVRHEDTGYERAADERRASC